MADVKITPRISCDNCGFTVDKVQKGSYQSASYHKPHEWGSCEIIGGRDADSYGGKSRLALTDLCEPCANAALDAASEALRSRRGEDRA